MDQILWVSLCKKATIHQVLVTTMLTTSKNSLIITLAGAWAIFKMKGHQYRWSAGGYDLEIDVSIHNKHSGYLMDSVFLVQCLYYASCTICSTALVK